MRIGSRTLWAMALAIAVVVAAAPAQAQFSKQELKCRSTIAKSASKISKTALKALVSCNNNNAKEGTQLLDCTDLAAVDAEKKKIEKAVLKLTGSVGIGGKKDKCGEISPASILYSGNCPDAVNCMATISDMADVASCVACMVQASAERLSGDLQGTATLPLGDAENSCQKAIGKAYSKQFGTILKERVKCQGKAEKDGATTTDDCRMAEIDKIDSAAASTTDAVSNSCADVNFGATNLDPCTAGARGANDVATCTSEATATEGEAVAGAVLDFSVAVVTTTTTSTTSTSTTLPGAPECPKRSEVVVWAGVGDQGCSSNVDCTNADPASPQTCNTNLGRCVTVSRSDAGWTGFGHDGDVNDKTLVGARLQCEGNDLPGACGECSIAGVDPLEDTVGNCRCARQPGETPIVCDEPFKLDHDDCGGARCECFFGAPFPTVVSGSPSCVVNRYAKDLTGTVNVDTGEAVVNSVLRSIVHFGQSIPAPCPLCGGACSNSPNPGNPKLCSVDTECGFCAGDGTVACKVDGDCGGVGGPCSFGTCTLDAVPGDGIRGGRCVGTSTPDHGKACDVMSINTSYPSRPAEESGSGYSLDCLPNNNISGDGLLINLTQTTGTASLSAELNCGTNDPKFAGQKCHCRVCNFGPLLACTGNADCRADGRYCSNLRIDQEEACSDNSDCDNISLGTCHTGVSLCTRDFTTPCSSNNDCASGNGGVCGLPTCSTDGGGIAQVTSPMGCTDAVCTDVGDDRGLCLGGPTDTFCDGFVEADGDGLFACTDNSDCTLPGSGACTLSKVRRCFLPTINATGSPDPQAPVNAAVFCIPPTGSPGINSGAGLPGPTRSFSQTSVKTFCPPPNDTVEYTPGSPNCPN